MLVFCCFDLWCVVDRLNGLQDASHMAGDGMRLLLAVRVDHLAKLSQSIMFVCTAKVHWLAQLGHWSLAAAD